MNPAWRELQNEITIREQQINVFFNEIRQEESKGQDQDREKIGRAYEQIKQLNASISHYQDQQSGNLFIFIFILLFSSSFLIFVISQI